MNIVVTPLQWITTINVRVATIPPIQMGTKTAHV